MMTNKYQNLTERIQPPGRLTDQVLAAARQTAGTNDRKKPLRQAVLCALLAVILAVIPFFAGDGIRQAAGPGQAANSGGTVSPGPAASPTAFGLTARVAGEDELYSAGPDSSLAMGSGSGMYWQGGFFTGSLFRVTGSGIRTVSLSLDRGEFYTYRVVSGLTEEQRRGIREAQARGELAPASIDQDWDGVWSFQEIIPAGNPVTADFSPDLWYGLWIPGAESGDSLKTDSHTSTDALDGACLTVTVTFEDGTEQTRVYRLHTGKLRLSDGGTVPLPELAGENEPYLYGIYAEPEQ